jgi:hypothetical protein
MTIHLTYILRIKPKRTSAYENMWISYTLDVVNLLHFSEIKTCSDFGFLCNINFKKNLPNDGPSRWLERVVGLRRL